MADDYASTGCEVLYLAKIAQLVERHLAKVEVAGSNPVFRSISTPLGFGYDQPAQVEFFILCRVLRQVRSSGGIGRHVGLKIQWPLGRAGSSPASSTEKAKI